MESGGNFLDCIIEYNCVQRMRGLTKENFNGMECFHENCICQ